MSADDWIECPVCHGLPEKLRNGYKQYYGKVSEEEYEKLKKEYESKSGEHPVRVDYEYTIGLDGEICLFFSAHCEKCNATWKHSGKIGGEKR